MSGKANDAIHKSLRDWPYRKVFLTGATGLIGGRVLIELLKLPQVDEVICLARPTEGRTAVQRVKQRLRRNGVSGKELDEALSRVRGVEGTITSELWGMKEEDIDLIRNEVELFIHCAASTSFIDEISCEEINVKGTRHMLNLVKGAKKLKRLVHFSSATLCGVLTDETIDEERALTDPGMHFFAYTRTKAESEKILWEQEANLPLLVVRPSITMASDSRDPKQAKLFLWSLVAMAQLPCLPIRLDARVDIVTVNFVVQSMMRLIARGDKLKHKCYHLTAGEGHASRNKDILDVAVSASARESFPTIIHPDDWTDAHEETIKEQGLETLYDALKLYLPFLNLNLVWDNKRLLDELGDDLPELQHFTDYLNEMIATMDPELLTVEATEAFGM